MPLIWHVLLNHVDFAVRINFEFGCALDNCGNFNHLHKSSMAVKSLNNKFICKTVFKIRMVMSDISKHMFFRMLTSILELKTVLTFFTEFGIKPGWPMVVLLTEAVWDTTIFRL